MGAGGRGQSAAPPLISFEFEKRTNVREKKKEEEPSFFLIRWQRLKSSLEGLQRRHRRLCWMNPSASSSSTTRL